MLKHHFKPFFQQGEDWCVAGGCGRVSDITRPRTRTLSTKHQKWVRLPGKGLATQLWETCHWFFFSHAHSRMAILSMTGHKTVAVSGGRSGRRQYIWSLSPQVINPSYFLVHHLSRLPNNGCLSLSSCYCSSHESVLQETLGVFHYRGSFAMGMESFWRGRFIRNLMKLKLQGLSLALEGPSHVPLIIFICKNFKSNIF